MSNKFWYRVHGWLASVELLLIFIILFYPSTAVFIVVALLMRMAALDWYIAIERYRQARHEDGEL
jgi:hypothetical protein